jgi:hypothetical protein
MDVKAGYDTVKVEVVGVVKKQRGGCRAGRSVWVRNSGLILLVLNSASLP